MLLYSPFTASYISFPYLPADTAVLDDSVAFPEMQTEYIILVQPYALLLGFGATLTFSIEWLLLSVLALSLHLSNSPLMSNYLYYPIVVLVFRGTRESRNGAIHALVCPHTANPQIVAC